MKSAFASLTLCLTLSSILPACGEEPASPAKPAAAAEAAATKEWIVSDWSEWKKQATGEEAKVEIVKSVEEKNPPKDISARKPLDPAAEKAGVLIIGRGEPFSAVKYEGKHPIPLNNYEISWDAMRIEGNDFFASLTFPVGSEKKCASFVTGGWGGWVVGVSAIGHMYANENETTRSLEFVSGRWYTFTLQVTTDCLRALIDGKEQFKVDIREKPISMHPSEIQKCVPLGFSSYDTKGAIRNVRIRPLQPGELKPDELPE